MVEEHHKRGFIGFWTPAEIVEMVDDGILSVGEAWLWSNIHSLMKGSDGGTCFATNEWLAIRCQLSPDRITRYVAHLRDLKLVEQVSMEGRLRHLITKSPESDPSCWQRGSLVASNDQRVEERVNTTSSFRRTTINRGSAQPNRAASRRNSTGAELDLKMKSTDEDLLAKQLYQATSKSKKYGGREVKPETWRKDLRRLIRDKGLDEVKQVMDWFCRNLDKDYVPAANTGQKFATKYDQLRDLAGILPSQDLDERETKIIRRVEDEVKIKRHLRPKIEASLDASIRSMDQVWDQIKSHEKIPRVFKVNNGPDRMIANWIINALDFATTTRAFILHEGRPWFESTMIEMLEEVGVSKPEKVFKEITE